MNYESRLRALLFLWLWFNIISIGFERHPLVLNMMISFVMAIIPFSIIIGAIRLVIYMIGI